MWLKYLRGTTNSCLEFGRNNENVVGFVDSDYADSLDRRISNTVYLPLVIMLSFEKLLCSLYMAMVEAVKKVIWLRDLFGEFSLDL